MAIQSNHSARLIDPEFTDPKGPFQNPDHPRHEDAVAVLAQMARLAQGSRTGNGIAVRPSLPTVQGLSSVRLGLSSRLFPYPRWLQATGKSDNQSDLPDARLPGFPLLIPRTRPLGRVGERLSHWDLRDSQGRYDSLPARRQQNSAQERHEGMDSPKRQTGAGAPLLGAGDALHEPEHPPGIWDRIASDPFGTGKPPDTIVDEFHVRTEDGNTRRLQFHFDNSRFRARSLNELLQAAMVDQPSRPGSKALVESPIGSNPTPANPEPERPPTSPLDLVFEGLAAKILQELSKVENVRAAKKTPYSIGRAAEDALAERAEEAGIKIVGRNVRCVTDDGRVRYFDLLLAYAQKKITAINLDVGNLVHAESKANSGRRNTDQIEKDEIIAVEGCTIESAKELNYGYKRGDRVVVPTLEVRVTVAYP